jgi:hypothetical protein
MKTKQQWAKIIIDFMQKNRVDTMESATTQIEEIVEMVQLDATGEKSIPANDEGPDAA